MVGKRRIYVASSWRNPYQPDIVRSLRMHGHEVYDFRNPAPGQNGFQWSEIDPKWRDWGLEYYRDALYHPIARHGFANDYAAMDWADTCVLALPSGRSAHIEAGWMKGTGKDLFILMMEPQEPELMYKLANDVFGSIADLTGALR